MFGKIGTRAIERDNLELCDPSGAIGTRPSFGGSGGSKSGQDVTVENEDNRMFYRFLGPGSSNNVLLKFQVKSSLRL
jgi:hypothetical protein